MLLTGITQGAWRNKNMTSGACWWYRKNIAERKSEPVATPCKCKKLSPFIMSGVSLKSPVLSHYVGWINSLLLQTATTISITWTRHKSDFCRPTSKLKTHQMLLPDVTCPQITLVIFRRGKVCSEYDQYCIPNSKLRIAKCCDHLRCVCGKFWAQNKCVCKSRTFGWLFWRHSSSYNPGSPKFLAANSFLDANNNLTFL